MIILRQLEFAKPDNNRGGGDNAKQYTEDQMKKASKDAYNNGRNDAFKEVQKRSEKAKKRAKVAKNIEEYTGIDDLKKWAKKKQDNVKASMKKNKQTIKKGFKYGAAGVLIGGAAYGGYKIGKKVYQNQKDKRKSERVRRKVRGYDSD